jgi:predicted RNA-binding protein YlqC (UPF0109 family)
MTWDDMALVGRIARAHGIRGQVIVNVETDFPRDRFRTGAELFVAPSDLGKLIGRQGRTAAALRTLAATAGEREGKDVTLEIRETR